MADNENADWRISAPKTSRFKPVGQMSAKEYNPKRVQAPRKGKKFVKIKKAVVRKVRPELKRREFFPELESQMGLSDLAGARGIDVGSLGRSFSPEILDIYERYASLTGQSSQRELFRFMIEENLRRRSDRPSVTIKSIITPNKKGQEGLLIQSTSVVWAAYVELLKKDWSIAYQMPPELWEELVAGAYKQSGFDSVILTPRSGDYGRDVIAEKYGVGCVKVLGSVKAYKPGHLVKHDDVRALLGVLSGERDASKGIITTTSDFAPRITQDPFISPFLPFRLELMNGNQLSDWLIELLSKKKLTTTKL